MKKRVLERRASRLLKRSQGSFGKRQGIESIEFEGKKYFYDPKEVEAERKFYEDLERKRFRI